MISSTRISHRFLREVCGRDGNGGLLGHRSLARIVGQFVPGLGAIAKARENKPQSQKHPELALPTGLYSIIFNQWIRGLHVEEPRSGSARSQTLLKDPTTRRVESVSEAGS